MAASPGLACGRRIGLLLLRRVLRSLQHRDDVHDRGARFACAGDTAAAHHGGRCAARHRTVDETENGRRLYCGARRLRSPRVGAIGRAAGGLARRVDHDRRRAVHGVLQRLVPVVHPAFQRARLSHRRHGDGRRGAGRGRIVDRQRGRLEPVQYAAMDRRTLSRHSAAAHWHLSCGCWRCSGRRLRASPTR